MLLSGEMSDMRRLNASNECRACSTAGRVLLRGKTLMMLTLEGTSIGLQHRDICTHAQNFHTKLKTTLGKGV